MQTSSLFVRPWFRGYLFYVLPCVNLFLCFFSPFSIAITSLGEERANLSAFRTFVRFVLVCICRFPLPLGVSEGLRFVIVALPGIFSYLFFICGVLFLSFSVPHLFFTWCHGEAVLYDCVISGYPPICLLQLMFTLLYCLLVMLLLRSILMKYLNRSHNNRQDNSLRICCKAKIISICFNRFTPFNKFIFG